MNALPWSADVDLAQIPERPGVYVFRDGEGRVLYVGKAASLRDRVRSYRRAGGDGRLMIRFLDQEAKTVEVLVTRTEPEPLRFSDLGDVALVRFPPIELAIFLRRRPSQRKDA
ncbi:MAG: nucleotide excision repair endonuclease [Planctomycetota bacterium]